MSNWQALELHRDGAVAEVRLSRPGLLNRFDMILHRELTEAFTQLASAVDVRAVLWSSTGKSFSAGGDTEVMLAAAESVAKRFNMVDEGRRLFRAVADFPKPLVVALEASVFGLGSSMILLSDAIVAHRGVQISDPHVRMGLVAGDGGVVAWPSAMGMVRAKRHLLSGDALTAEEAWRLGIVTDLVDDPTRVLPDARELAQRLAGLPPLAVQLTKRALSKVLLSRADEAFDLGFYLEAVTFGSADMQEAVKAFREKRPGIWRGE